MRVSSFCLFELISMVLISMLCLYCGRETLALLVDFVLSALDLCELWHFMGAIESALSSIPIFPLYLLDGY